MRPLISIVVPVYNVQDCILECLNSLKYQTYNKIEIILVDDGSTDESGRICDEFARGEERARVFHRKNGGVSRARNFGIKKAKGKFICFVDSDDRVKEDFVKKMVEKIIDGNIDIVICGYNDNVPKTEILTGREATVRLLIKQENMEIVAWNKMYRKELFNDISYPEGLNYEDNLTTYKLLSKAKKVKYISESLYAYIERPGSITKSDDKEEKLQFREEAAKEAIKYFDGQKDLEEASEIAMLTAKLAWVDFAVNGKVEQKYLNEAMEWIKKNKGKLLINRHLTQKLKLYIFLITNWGGKLYIMFRKIRHE